MHGVIFDFGRVLSRWKPDGLFRTYEAELGLRADTINTIMFDSVHWHRALVGELSMSEFWQAIGPDLNLFSDGEIERFRRRYFSDERMNTEVVELVRSLPPHCQRAICSNHPAGLSDWLEQWGIADLFEVIFCSGEEGVAKPDPRAYQRTLQRLGVVACDAVFIDDTEMHVEAARQLGLYGIVFTDAASLQQELHQLPWLSGSG